MLTHRTLRLTSRTRREIDIGQLIRGDLDAEIAVGMVLAVPGVDDAASVPRAASQGLVQRGSAAGFGQHQTASGPGQHRRNPISREMRLNRQIHPTSLENRKDGGQPIQIALRHHRHHTLTAQPPRQQRPSQPISASVQLPVRQAADSPHTAATAIRMRPHPLLKQLMHPDVRQLPPRSRQPLQLEIELLHRQQTLPPMLRTHIDRHQLQRRQVITGDPAPHESASNTSVRYRSLIASCSSLREMPIHNTMSSARSSSIPVGSSPVRSNPVGSNPSDHPVGSNTVSKNGPLRLRSRLRSSTGKSLCACSSDSA